METKNGIISFFNVFYEGTVIFRDWKFWI